MTAGARLEDVVVGSNLVFPLRRLALDGLAGGKDDASPYEGGPTKRWLNVKQKNWTVEEDRSGGSWGGQAMMHLARRASLAVVLLLLASIGTASAECAWVLWVNEWFDASLDLPPSDVQAYPLRSDCLAALEQTAQTFKVNMGSKAEIGQDTRSGSGTLSVSTNGHSVLIRCIPDTIDPRGRKGK